MVIRNDRELSCRIFEIKHSDRRDPRQRRHILDPEMRRETERLHGEITEAAVIYRGPDAEEDGVRYINVVNFLKDLALQRRSEGFHS